MIFAYPLGWAGKAVAVPAVPTVVWVAVKISSIPFSGLKTNGVAVIFAGTSIVNPLENVPVW